MSTELIPQNFGQVSTRFQNLPVEDDLSSGIQSSFGLIGYKGKVWSIRYRGDEMQLMREDGDGPKSSIEVVILKSSKSISKIWYEQGYVEGSNAAPDCFSNNGVTPDPTSTKIQSESCAMCPHNQWGSRITPAGKQGKACSDSKRTAVVPVADINNEMFGGPMLLRVPAASLQDLAMYGQKMQQMGYPYYAIATRIQFDPAESFPKFKISAIRPLSDEEADLVISLRDGHQVERILSESEFATPGVAGTQAQTPEQVFEQPPQTTQPNTSQGNQQATQKPEVVQSQEATQQAAQQADEQAAQQVTQPVQEPVQETESDEDREARELEERLAAIKAKKAQATQQGNSGNGKATTQPAEPSEPAETKGAGGFGGAVKATSQSAKPDTTQANGANNPSTTGQTATTNASPSESVSDDGGNMASDFEANLDTMLADLLPAGD